MLEVAVTDDALCFVRVMVDEFCWSSETLLDLMEKPHKWDTEFRLWCEAGRPIEGEALDMFLAALSHSEVSA